MADKLPTAMPPASEPFPGSRTPGWNDPPTLAYNPLSASCGDNRGRPRINLNKRVAYPLQGTAVATSSKPTAVVLPNQSGACLPPPPPASTTILQPVAVVHPMPHASSEQEHITLPTDAAAISIRCLREQVPRMQELINVRREEIEQCLGTIEQLWQTGNISPAVQQKIYRLSEAVARCSFYEAMEIYTSLLANHGSECASWTVTLRNIVLSILTNAATTSGTELINNSTATNTIANAHLTSIHGTNNATGSSNLVTVVPTMSVTAMPRSSTEDIALSSTNPTASSMTSRVQQI